MAPIRTSGDVRFRAAVGGIADVDVLRPALLASDIIEMILDGRQPPALHATKHCREESYSDLRSVAAKEKQKLLPQLRVILTAY